MGLDLPFIEVDGKFYLSEEKVPKLRDMMSAGLPLVPQWVRHTARVPRGYLRYQVLMLLKEQELSGSDIASRMEQETKGRWRPSPGSLYPLLKDLEDRGFAEELPSTGGTKKYRLTDLGQTFLNEETQIASQMRERLESGVLRFPPFFNLPDQLRFLPEAGRRILDSLFVLVAELSGNPDQAKATELEKLLKSTADKLDRLAQRHDK